MTTLELRSFDRTECADAHYAEPDRYRELFVLLDSAQPCALRGSGLSYCLASGGDGVTSVSTRHFNRVLAFDADRRLLTVEPGFTVGQLVDFAGARSSFFPVLPGHPSITVGGCAAFNVHGKTQHNVGHFGDHVESLVLLHPDHGEIRCSRGENAELFDLTIGGMGLTGYIASITLRLERLPGSAVRRVAHPVANLWEATELMTALANDADALYSWNDFAARGDRFGRGVVYDERFVDEEVDDATRYRRLRPDAFVARPSAYSRLTTKLINAAYLTRAKVQCRQQLSVHDATFPINGMEIYYTLFGRQGFREYQLVISYEAWDVASRAIRRLLEHSRVPVTLGSLKLFAGRGTHLDFRADGVCLTLDVPATPESLALFGEIDRVAVDVGAVVNLAKDSRVDAKTVRALFDGYDGFGAAVEAFDARRRFDSALRRRLEL